MQYSIEPPLPQILTHFDGVKPTGNNSWMALCPAHRYESVLHRLGGSHE